MVYMETFHARIVHLLPLRGQGDESGWRERGPTRLYFKSKCPVPALLHVSHEARAVAASVYSRTFRTDDYSPYTWLCYQLDTLYMDWEFSWFFLPRQTPIVFTSLGEDARNIKYLALGTDERKGDSVALGMLNLELCQVLSEFSDLQKLTIYAPRSPHDRYPSRYFRGNKLEQFEECRLEWIEKGSCNESVESGQGGSAFRIPEIEMKLKLELLEMPELMD